VLNKPLVYLATIYHLMRCKLKTGRFPYLVPPGGSSLLGVIGYVNAAFELRQQIASGEIPEPQRIYVACGTMGTAAGLHLGLRAAKVSSHVVAVRVTSDRFVNRQAMIALTGRANAFIHSLDPSFPVFDFSLDNLDIRHGYFGKQYALFTEEAMQAACLMRDREGIRLDGTYTGKTLAALIDDARNRVLRGRSVLFWNTLNSRNLSESLSGIDYHELPRCFHRYFEDEVQPLDRGSYTSQLPA
jgi:1-aminocyclopropane-1-carboxylate deaminase/D-cysteine desulfhydrase-like pyridoxal-dependent ACC family enzyme